MLRKKSQVSSYFKPEETLMEEEKLTEEEKLCHSIQRKRGLIKQIKRDIVAKVCVFTFAFIITFTFVFGVTKAPTNDMFPAIHEGDVVVYYRLGQMVNTDVAVYKTPDGLNIGRVQAAAGSEINKTEGDLLTIDGNIQPIQKRSGLFYKTDINDAGALRYPSTVPEEEYLILGDERESAQDSRAYGYIPRKDIKGKVFTIIRRRPL